MVMLRRTIEAECVRLGANGRVLHAKIQELQQLGVLTPIQAGNAHAIRAFGNYGAHAVDDLLDDIDEEELEAAFRLTVALVRGLAARQAPTRRRGGDSDRPRSG